MSEDDIDIKLVRRVQKGDKKAFDLLVLKYQQRIMNLASRFVRNHSDAMDITQDTFIKAYRALPNFRGDSAFYTWVYRIAVNTAKNYLSVRARRPLESDKDISEVEQIRGEDSLKDYATPEHLLLKEQTQELIIKTIEDMPEDLRVAITLREVEGLSYGDIAVAMGCPIGTVRSRIFRARETIERELKTFVTFSGNNND